MEHTVDNLAEMLGVAFSPKPRERDGRFSLANLDCKATQERSRGLYWLGDGRPSEVHTKGHFILGPGQKISSSTPRNSFFLDVWSKHSLVRDVSLSVTFAGKIRLKLFKVSGNNSIEVLAREILTAGATKTEVISIGAIDHFPAACRFFWEVEALETSSIINIAYTSNHSPAQPANLIVTIRTFGRTRDVVALLAGLCEQAHLPQHADMLEHIAFVFLDTSGEADELYGKSALPDSLNLFAYSSENLGGGGNAGQLLLDVKRAVEKSKVDVNAVVVLDDDLDISIEALYRYWAFASFQKGDVITTLPIFMKSEPGCIWEDGGIWGRFAPDQGSNERLVPFPRLLRHGVRMGGNNNLDLFSHLNYPEYGTFIFYAIPWKAFNQLQLPSAFFLRGDDVEYSLRASEAGWKLLSNPNLAAWHEPAHSYAQEYMAILHGLIINMRYGVCQSEVFLEFFLDRFRHHSAILDDFGLSIYGAVIETLVNRTEILEPGFPPIISP